MYGGIAASLFRRHALLGFLGISVVSGLSACALEPVPEAQSLAEQRLSNLTLPPQWTEESPAGSVSDNWIATLGDPKLTALVAEAIRYNTDIQIAAGRVAQAVANVEVAGGDLMPSVSVLGRGGGKLGGDGSGMTGWLISASWELDVWGRVRYGRRAAEDQYASMRADAAAAAQSVAALVAKSWFLTIDAERQRDVAAEMVAAATELLRVAQARQRIGPGSELDVTEARASLQTLRDSERQLTLARSQAKRSLEVLLGRYPAAEITAGSRFAALPAPPAAGVPSQLLERRPDIVAAQRRVDAAFDQVGAADAARLPRLSLSAGATWIDSELFVLKQRDEPVVSGGGSLFMPLFNGGALKAQAEARRAEQAQAAAVWAQVSLRAFNEVEGALATEAALRDREQLLIAAARDNDAALTLEQARYRIGSRDVRAVLRQQMKLYASRSALLRVEAERRVNRVNLHLALGGGFSEYPALQSAEMAQRETE